jgi:hypothetical protein
VEAGRKTNRWVLIALRREKLCAIAQRNIDGWAESHYSVTVREEDNTRMDSVCFFPQPLVEIRMKVSNSTSRIASSSPAHGKNDLRFSFLSPSFSSSVCRFVTSSAGPCARHHGSLLQKKEHGHPDCTCIRSFSRDIYVILGSSGAHGTQHISGREVSS